MAEAPKPGIPDMAYIRRHVPIADVARELDLRPGTNGLFHCWRPERHRNSDANASVSILKTANRIKCFGCDSALLSPIDLVADVRGLLPKDAALWIAERFEVPTVPTRKHFIEPPRVVHQAGFETALGLLIRSGLWARLSGFTQRLVPVLLEFADQPDAATRNQKLCLSFHAINRYVGSKSRHGIIAGLAELEEIHWLKRESASLAGSIRPTGCYLLTPFSDELQELANSTAAEFKAEIAIQRELRREVRKQRKRELANRVPKNAVLLQHHDSEKWCRSGTEYLPGISARAAAAVVHFGSAATAPAKSPAQNDGAATALGKLPMQKRTAPTAVGKPADQPVTSTGRCASCGGSGRVDAGYCSCALGRDLERAEAKLARKAQTEPAAPGAGPSAPEAAG